MSDENKPIITISSIINDSFSQKIDAKYLDPFIKKINASNSIKFAEDIVVSNDQISLDRELIKNKMVNDKEKLIYNNTNTTSFPLLTYRQDIRIFNLHPDAQSGGFETLVDEKQIEHYQNINLEPNSTLNAPVDKQKNREYTSYEYHLVKSLTDTSKVHFILESIAYIYYQYDYNLNIANTPENVQRRQVKILFHDRLNSSQINTENYNNFVINESEEENICHAIRAILLCCAFRGLINQDNITIYLPIRYDHIFDRDSNLRNSPRIFEATFIDMFRTVTSILNGVVPKTQILGQPDPNDNNNRPILRAAVDFELGELSHQHSFSINVNDYYAALSIISRSFGIMYFNGRNYDGNLNHATNITRLGAHVVYIPATFENRIAYVNKFLRYKINKDIIIHRSSRLSNKLLWLTRRRFIIWSEYIKWTVGSLVDSRLRQEFGGIYRKILNVLEHLGDNIINATLTVDGDKISTNLLSMAKNTIHINCDLSLADAYKQSNDYDQNLGINRSRAWFGQPQYGEPNGNNILITDKSIDHPFLEDGDGNPIQDCLFLVEYCNAVANWNSNYYGSILNEIEISKYHEEDESHIEWNKKDIYLFSNGLIGESHLYGRYGSILYNIYAYSNTRNVDCTYYYYPNIYRIKKNEKNRQYLRIMIKSQDYLSDNHEDLYYHKINIKNSSASQFELEDFE